MFVHATEGELLLSLTSSVLTELLKLSFCCGRKGNETALKELEQKHCCICFCPAGLSMMTPDWKCKAVFRLMLVTVGQRDLLVVQKISLLEIMVLLLLLLLAVDLEVETSRMPLLWTHTSSNTLLRRQGWNPVFGLFCTDRMG